MGAQLPSCLSNCLSPLLLSTPALAQRCRNVGFAASSMASWNTRPSTYVAAGAGKLDGSYLDRATALKSVSLYSLVALAAAGASKYGLPMLYWLHFPHAAAIGAALGLTAVFGVLRALGTFSKWRDSSARIKAQAGLGPAQRQLLGLPPTPPVKPGAPPPDAAPAAARAATLLATPISPAQRPLPLMPSGLSDVTPQRGLLATPGSAGRSSLAASPGARHSPWACGPAVATPQDLHAYVAAYSGRRGLGAPELAGGDAAAAAAAAAVPGMSAGGSLAGGQLCYDSADGGAAATSPALPVGRDAPAYRPSLLARKAAAASGSAGAASEGLTPSADAEAGRVMRDVLQMEVPELLVWCERFREWLSATVLGPLLALMDTAHEEPNALLAALLPGGAAPQLPPIASLLEGDAPALPAPGQAGSGGGADAAGGGSGSGGSAAEDARLLASRLCESLRVSQLPYGYDPAPLLAALHRYSELLRVLTGRRPGELLPPAPPSYIGRRLRALAAGTCVQAFTWNGGGEHGGSPWSPELPSDAGLLLYLFAAFLDAPGWAFADADAPGEGSRGAPLYLGSLAGRPPAAYSALLGFRPDKPGPGAVVVVASQLASTAPRFSLLLAGGLVTLAERDGLFKVLLMWLQYHLVARNGLVGGRYLSEAAMGGLEDVLAPVVPQPNIPQRVYSWWFPPNKAV